MGIHPLRGEPGLAARPVAPFAGIEPPAVKPHQARLRWGLGLFLLSLAAVAAVGGWYVLRPIPVVMALSRRGDAVDAVYASGVVDYVRQAHIAPVTTAPIRKVPVEEGQPVTAGQVLAQLDDGPQQGTALQLESQAIVARAAADRARRLFEAGFGARAVYEDTQSQRAAAEAAAASARARLADYRLTAPFAGRLLRRDAEPGDLAVPGKILFVVADERSLRITADVDERDVGHLAPGMEAVVRADAFTGRTFAARITEITPQGDATGRIFRVRLAVDPASGLRPGMNVETNLITAHRTSAVLVPSSAVAGDAVWTVGDGRARRRAVTLGARGGGWTEVVAGLPAETPVIADPTSALHDGVRVSATVRGK